MRVGRLKISRFKSIRSLDLACRKVNVFIGPPDTGKTNILDALNLLSRIGWGLPIDSALRLTADRGFEPLFFQQFFDKPIEISLDQLTMQASLSGAERRLNVRFDPSWSASFEFGARAGQMPGLAAVRFYAFAGPEAWQYVDYGDSIVKPPDGSNLMYIARHNGAVYEFLKERVSEIDWKLHFDQVAKRFRLSEVRQDAIIDYNLELLSDSVKRFFFYGAILLTSKDAVLVFDEPDVQAFPPYPKDFGRMISEDESNQFFLTTHNPYLLSELAEKTPSVDLGIFICRRHPDGGTEARVLAESEVQEVIDWGASTFFNLTKFAW